jgi:integrase
MYTIVERNFNGGTFYEKMYITEEGNTLSRDIVHFRNAKVNYDGEEYIFLYDIDMNPIPEIFDYINFHLQDSSPNHRYIALTALKLLYCFLILYNLKLDSLTKDDVKNLISFLQGIPKDGTLYKLDLKTLRDHSTVLTYLPVYRSFVTYLGCENSVLTKKSTDYKLVDIPESETKIKIYKYEVGLSEYEPEMSTPRYISVDEFKRILAVIRSEYTVREECIVRLMFELGLRLGEVLGLTNEDIVEKKGSAFLHLRNRCSDSFDQLAKGCMNVRKKTKSIYKTKKYKTQGVGYQEVYLNDHLLEKINDYVNEFHLSDSLTFQMNYEKFAIADSVGDNQEDSSNFYLFINSIGRPLSANLWGKTLREIFVKAGLDVDKGSREVNLSHRFRHGFAMFMVKYKKVDALILKGLLRHKRISSVNHYYRPTDEEIIEMKTEFVDSIYDVVSELSI